MSIFYLLTFIVCSGYVLLMVFYRAGWSFTPNHYSQKGEKIKCSIIIPVRNEEENIKRILSCLQKQSYLDFEIIIVNDHSTDRTVEILNTYSTLRLFHLSKKEKGKKEAIKQGIRQANGKLILTTDADCEMGQDWISSVVAFYEKEKPKMIIAPVLISEEKNLFEKLQSIEITALSASACGSLYFQLPFLCSGANLIYEKEAFDSVNGFEENENTLSGDDIFLMLKFQKKFGAKQIRYFKSKEAAVFTKAEKNFSSVLMQRKRWASKTFLYGFSYITFIAVFVFLANFFTSLVLPLAMLISAINVKFACALTATLLLKCFADYMLVKPASKFFEKKLSTFDFITASLIYPFYAALIGIISPFTKYSWKERQS